MKASILKSVALALILALAGMAVSSCSTAPPPRPEVDIEQEKFTYQNGSLWPGKSKKNMFFSDNKASAVGDIVTVHIVEETTAINKASTMDDSAVDNSLTVDTGGTSATQIKLGGGSKFRGNGSTGRSDQFSATVSCMVTEIFANGNMKIEGQRRMQINNEEQFVVVRGIVRRDDITYNNTVISSKIADADILYTGGGGMDGGKRPNWLGRTFQKVWPF